MTNINVILGMISGDKLLPEKNTQKNRDIFVYFLNLEKEVNGAQWEKLCGVLEGYLLNGRLLNVIKAYEYKLVMYVT